MTTYQAPMCLVCVHYDYEGVQTCAAYPDGIPDAIWVHYYDHRQPYLGDCGIRFEPDPKWDAEMIAVSLELYEEPG